MTEYSKDILLGYVPNKMQYLPESLQILYGFLAMITTFEYSEKGDYKYNVGCDIKSCEIANALGWCERYTYRALGVLWKLNCIEYQDEKFFCKYFNKNKILY